jgi:hypothetical protein
MPVTDRAKIVDVFTNAETHLEREVAVADYRKGFKINPCH